MNDLRAASVQFQHRPGDKATNLGVISDFTEKAAAENADLVVFPEMCITGYWHLRDLPREDLEVLAEPIPTGPSTQALIGLARQHNLTVGAGLIEKGDGGQLFNTYVVAMPDGRTVKHYYVHESVGIATGMLITALHHAGLATLTHTPSPMKFLTGLCDRPVAEKPVMILAVGHPAKDATVPAAALNKKPLEEILTVISADTETT